jgi:hypothetical protein
MIKEMKLYLFLLSVPLLSHAQFSRPELIARLAQTGAWNAPDNIWCFASEPGVLKGQIHLGCLDADGPLMAQWGKAGFKVLARAQDGEYFSHPLNSFNKISWYSYNEWGILRSYESSRTLEVAKLKNLGPLRAANDSLLNYDESSPDRLWHHNGS